MNNKMYLMRSCFKLVIGQIYQDLGQTKIKDGPN